MVLNDELRNERRLNRVAYANIGLGLLTLFVWAIPGPAMVPSFWRHIDQDFHGQSGTVAMVIKVTVVIVVVGFWLLSAVSLVNGFLILKRRRHRLCMILSGISLLGTPLNLIVRILSLTALNNPCARNVFANGSRV